MENTSNYNLKKPAGDDFYNVDDFNSNADIIDTQLKNVNDKADGKVDEIAGKGLSTNDYTTTEKNKLAGLSNYDDSAIQLVVDTLGTNFTTHDNSEINTATGVHGIRNYNSKLEYFDGGVWVEIKTGGGGIAPGNVSSLTAQPGSGNVTLKWTDPNDVIVEGTTLVAWSGTKIVRKAGSYPASEIDGVVVVDNKTRNAYSSAGFVDSGLTNGTLYYYQAFPYSTTGAVNLNTANRVSATPQAFVTYGITIDTSNSNPATCVTYTDDAVGMTAASAAWDAVFAHYPCMLLNGVEGVKLNPNDFTKDVNGNTVNLASPTVGDVMIAFPRMGLKISTSGNIVTIKMTNDPDDVTFEYNAHTRETVGKEKFYLGAYKGFLDTSKLRSWSGKTPTATQTRATFRTQAEANGTGYDQSGFYQLTFRQCMYLLKYKNLDSQTALGRGYVDANSAAIATGGTNANGMDFGEATGKLQMKLFGIEDFWGNIYEFIDGLWSDASRNIMTGTDAFNDTGEGYVNNGQGATSNIGNYMSAPQGSTKTGFIAKTVAGSATTYFCDDAHLYPSCTANFGGTWHDASTAGAFLLDVLHVVSTFEASFAGRLMFL